MTRRIHPVMLTAAMSVSAVGLAASAMSSLDRSPPGPESVVYTGFALAATIGAHMLPAISRSVISRALWCGFLVVVVYGHAAFLAGAAGRAGDQRAAGIRTSDHTAALQRQLDALGARPLPAVADALATATARSARATAGLTRCEATTPGRCSSARATVASADASVLALTTELDAARHAAKLHERLTAAAQQHDTRRADAALDPGAAALATLTGIPASSIQTAGQMLTALLVELFAAFLWTIALPRRHDDNTASLRGSTSTADHAMATAPTPQGCPVPGQIYPREGHLVPRRAIPSHDPGPRATDRPHQPGPGRAPVASSPAHRHDPRSADGRPGQSLPTARWPDRHRMGQPRPANVESG